MKQRKTALASRLGAVAISVLFLSDARATGDLTAAQSPLVCSMSAERYDLVMPNAAFGLLPPAETIIGMASFYHEPQQTASGEPFDPDAFTAAAQLDIRDKFGGIHFGVKYRPSYAVAEYGDKKLILKFNDVGTLRPGRKFDLSRAAMAYFDGLEKGLLPDVRVTPLPLGQTYPAGPVTDTQLAALRIGSIDIAVAATPAIAPEPAAAQPDAPVPPPAKATSISARLYVGEAAVDES